MSQACAITLPSRLSSDVVSTILAEIREAGSSAIQIDATALASVTTQAVQFFLALSQHCRTLGSNLSIIDPAHQLESAVGRLGLAQNVNVEWKSTT